MQILKNSKSQSEASTVSTRRNFINKYGKLAAITPVALTSLVSPATSAAPKSCRGNGVNKCT